LSVLLKPLHDWKGESTHAWQVRVEPVIRVVPIEQIEALIAYLGTLPPVGLGLGSEFAAQWQAVSEARARVTLACLKGINDPTVQETLQPFLEGLDASLQDIQPIAMPQVDAQQIAQVWKQVDEELAEERAMLASSMAQPHVPEGMIRQPAASGSRFELVVQPVAAVEPESKEPAKSTVEEAIVRDPTQWAALSIKDLGIVCRTLLKVQLQTAALQKLSKRLKQSKKSKTK
jgi:hypothetical protein